MGLSEEDKKKHPFFIEQRFKKAITKEYKEAVLELDCALQDYLYHALKAHFQAHKEEPSVRRVVEGTMALLRGEFKRILETGIPILTEKMLEKFDLVKE